MSTEHLSNLTSEFLTWLKDWSIMLGLAAGAIGGIAIFMWNATIGKLANKSQVSREISLAIKKAEIELQHSMTIFNKYKIQTDKDIASSIRKAEIDLKQCYSDFKDILHEHEEREIARAAIAAKENSDSHKRIIDILLDKLK